MPEKTLDMTALIFAWQDDSPDNQYYLDIRTGNVRLVNRNLLDLRDLTDEIEKNRHRFFYLPKLDKAVQRKDLMEFLETVQDEKLKRVLPMAFESPHWLSAFRKILEGNADEGKRFEDYRQLKMEGRVKEWLKANAIPSTIQTPDELDEEDDEEHDEDFDYEDFSP